MEPLSKDERSELIDRFLARFGKKLDRSAKNRVVASPQTANPLFLRALLDELRQFGDFSLLNRRIDDYLESADPEQLYVQILTRWETDYGADLVSRCFALLTFSRRGLSEVELLDLLGD